MNILATQYSLPTRSFEIYLSGCVGKPHCKGCHSKETWNFNQGELWSEVEKSKIFRKVSDFVNVIDSIWILGGEPLDNDIEQVCDIASFIRKNNDVLWSFSPKSIWLFTHYEIDRVKELLKDKINLFDFIKCGRYIPELKTETKIQFKIKLATSNQYIIKINH